MDKTDVTNAQFEKFVKATGYITVAERKPRAEDYRGAPPENHGAQVGDLYMSLIHTCELDGANPFDYLTQLQRHARELQQDRATWMPWNYPATPDHSSLPQSRTIMASRRGRKG